MLKWYEWFVFVILLLLVGIGTVIIVNALMGNQNVFVRIPAPYAGAISKVNPVAGLAVVVTGGNSNFSCGPQNAYCDPNMGLVCRSGSCVCFQTGFTFCPSFGCIDLNSFSPACGSCSNSGCSPLDRCCSGACRNLTTTTDCGSCGNVCTGPTGASMACCAGACSNISNDPQNCGACFQPVPTTGFRCCSGIATPINDNNCQSCGTKCPTGTICDPTTQTCISGCPTGLVLCGGVCKNLQSDNFNCAFCNSPCPTGTFCLSGQCVPNNACPEGSVFFDGVCIALNSNSNCGQVGVQCPNFCVQKQCTCVTSANCPAGYICDPLTGQCVPPTCPDGTVFCGASVSCVSLVTGDNFGRNCGMCGLNCASGLCDQGKCACSDSSQCPMGYDCLGNRCELH